MADSRGGFGVRSSPGSKLSSSSPGGASWVRCAWQAPADAAPLLAARAIVRYGGVPSAAVSAARLLLLTSGRSSALPAAWMAGTFPALWALFAGTAAGADYVARQEKVSMTLRPGLVSRPLLIIPKAAGVASSAKGRRASAVAAGKGGGGGKKQGQPSRKASPAAGAAKKQAGSSAGATAAAGSKGPGSGSKRSVSPRIAGKRGRAGSGAAAGKGSAASSKAKGSAVAGRARVRASSLRAKKKDASKAGASGKGGGGGGSGGGSENRYAVGFPGVLGGSFGTGRLAGAAEMAAAALLRMSNAGIPRPLVAFGAILPAGRADLPDDDPAAVGPAASDSAPGILAPSSSSSHATDSAGFIDFALEWPVRGSQQNKAASLVVQE